MQKQKKRRNTAKPGARSATPKRRKNPVVIIRESKQRKANGKRRKNPSGAAPLNFVKDGAVALAGLVATRQGPQLILGAKNAGWLGYLANVAAAIATAMLAGKFAGKRAGSAALIGGGLYTVNRVLTEQFSPAGKFLSLSGVGDASAAASLGTIRQGYYPVPFSTRGGVPAHIVDTVRASLPPAAAPQSGSVAGCGNRVSARRF